MPSVPNFPSVGRPDWREYARLALQEDRASQDVTTQLLGERADRPATGGFRAEGDVVVAGLPLVAAVFGELEPSAVVDQHAGDGTSVKRGDLCATVRASGGALLSGERVALNYLQHLSGIATGTRRAVEAVAGTKAVITDTRKTTPGLRQLEKYAVRVGGGVSHRPSLADAVLWKDNHWALLGLGQLPLADAIRDAPDGLPVCVEVESDEQLDAALAAGVRWILIDNQPPETVARWVGRAGPDVTVEASGGISADNVRAYAEAGADRISMGALTSAPVPVSISFEIGFAA